MDFCVYGKGDIKLWVLQGSQKVNRGPVALLRELALDHGAPYHQQLRTLMAPGVPIRVERLQALYDLDPAFRNDLIELLSARNGSPLHPLPRPGPIAMTPERQPSSGQEDAATGGSTSSERARRQRRWSSLLDAADWLLR